MEACVENVAEILLFWPTLSPGVHHQNDLEVYSTTIAQCVILALVFELRNYHCI